MTYILEDLLPASAFRLLRLLHPVPHLHQPSINVLKTSNNGIPNGLLDLLLHEPSRERPQRLVQEVVLAIADAELEPVNLDVHRVDLEERGLIGARGGMQADVRGDAIAANEDIGETGVFHTGKASLLVIVEGNVAHVCLDLREREVDAVVRVI